MVWDSMDRRNKWFLASGIAMVLQGMTQDGSSAGFDRDFLAMGNFLRDGIKKFRFGFITFISC